MEFSTILVTHDRTRSTLPPLIKLPIEPICQLSFTVGGLDYSETAVFASSLRLTDASGNVYLGEAYGAARVDPGQSVRNAWEHLFWVVFAHKHTK